MNLLKKILLAALVTVAPSFARAANPVRYVQISTNTLTQQTGAFNVATGSATLINASTVTATLGTFTNITAASSTFTWVNTSTIQVNGNQIQATAGTRTYTLPDAGANASIIESTGTQTLSNKTLDNATLSTNMAAATKILTGLGAGAAAGNSVRYEQLKVLQVVMFTVVGSSATASATYVPTALTGSITPSSSSNKVLVMAWSNMQSGGAGSSFQATIARNGTNLLDAAGQADTQSTSRCPASLGYLDGPATTSSTTYAIYMKSASGTSTWGATGTQVLILAEIAP